MAKNLAIIGSGPAGLSAAINAASEGIDVTVYDRASALGGQFKESNSIQNYPGFPNITGADLSALLLKQSFDFGVNFCAPFNVSGLNLVNGKIEVVGDDWQRYPHDAVVLALGVQWRRLDAPGVAMLVGRGVYYGAPPVAPKDEDIVIVGAGNSAGQEAVKLAQLGNGVTVLVRKTLDAGMSKYLIDQLRGQPGITVLEGVEIMKAARGDDGIHLLLSSTTTDLPPTLRADKVLIYIGAMPHTYWLRDTLKLDPRGYIMTGFDLALADGRYQTSVAGVFAIGDARLGSCKRIGAAVGEGSSVIPQVHQFFAKQGESK